MLTSCSRSSRNVDLTERSPHAAPPLGWLRRLSAELRGLGQPFWMIWLGESIALLGSKVFTFALGVYIFQQTGSVVEFSTFVVAGTAAALVALPIANSVVDRHDRRIVVIVADCVSVVTTAAIVLILWLGELRLLHLYLFTVVAACTEAFHAPAYQALIASLLQPSQFTRSNGLLQMSANAFEVAAPLLAAVLLALTGLQALAMMDLILFVIGGLLIWSALWGPRQPERLASARDENFSFKLIAGDFTESLAHLVKDRQLRTLLIYVVLQASMFAITAMLLVPLVLSNHSSLVLGAVLSCASAGAIAGSFVIVLLDSPRNLLKPLLICDVVMCLFMSLTGLTTAPVWYCVFTFIVCAAASAGISYRQALWTSSLPDERRGGAFAVLLTVRRVCICSAVLGAAFLAERVIQPALAHVASVPFWRHFAAAEGGASALLFVLCGSLGLLASLVAAAYRPLRKIG